MKLLSNIQFTLNGIFDLYLAHGRKTRSISWWLTLLTILVANVVSLPLYFVYGEFLRAGYSRHGDYVDHFTNQPFISVTGMLSLCLFAIVLFRNREDFPENPKLRWFFRELDSRLIIRFVLFAIGGTIVSILLVHFQNPRHFGGQDFGERMNLLGSGSSSLTEWLKSLIGLVNTFLPFIVAYLYMSVYMNERSVTQPSKTSTFWSFILVLFFLELCIGQVFSLLYVHVLSLLGMLPFRDFWMPILLFVVILVFFFGLVIMPLSSAMIFPFLFQSKEEKVIENNDLLDS